MSKIDDYQEINEDWFKPMLPYYSLGIVITVISYLIWYNVYVTVGLACGFYFVFYKIQAYRPRKCPSCHEKMKPDYSKGLTPEYYYCDNCRLKLKTHTENLNSA